MWDRTRLRKPRYVSYTHVTINWVTLVDSDVQDDKVSVDNNNVSLTWDFFSQTIYSRWRNFWCSDSLGGEKDERQNL